MPVLQASIIIKMQRVVREKKWGGGGRAHVTETRISGTLLCTTSQGRKWGGNECNGSRIRTPSTAGSSWTLLKGAGSSTDKSLTSDARKMMYWYGSCTGGMNSDGGLPCAKKRRQVPACATGKDNKKRKRAAHVHTYIQPLGASLPKRLNKHIPTHFGSHRKN